MAQTLFDIWHPRPAVGSSLDDLRRRLAHLKADGVTLQITAPSDTGVKDLYPSPASIAAAVLALHSDGLRVGIMEWAGADTRLVHAHLDRLTRLVDALGGDGSELAFVELDAEEEWVDDSASEVAWAIEALEAGWADLGSDCPEITITTIPSLPLDTHGLLQLPRVKRWRPQWYNFRKPNDPAHWSHKLAPPRQQMAAWQKTAREVLARGWVSEIEPGLACYWQSGLTDAGRALSPTDALDLSLSLAQAFDGGSQWVGYWSSPWVTGQTEAWWMERASLEGTAPEEVETPPLPPIEEGAGSNEIRALQRQLGRWGYSVGAADGKVGPRTRAAAEAYRTDADRVRSAVEKL